MYSFVLVWHFSRVFQKSRLSGVSSLKTFQTSCQRFSEQLQGEAQTGLGYPDSFLHPIFLLGRQSFASAGSVIRQPPVRQRFPLFASGLQASWTLASWPPPELWLCGHLPLAICSPVFFLLRVVGLWAASCRSWVSVWLVFSWLAAESQVSGSQVVWSHRVRKASFHT